MQDLAGLLVEEGIQRAALPGGEEAQGARGEIRVIGQDFQRGDHAVAPERRHVPRHARVGHPALRRDRQQHLEIDQRAREECIEALVVRDDAGRLRP